ncbi:MAG: type II toxin-antitoxin system HicB family antitoxin [Planctomycetaceae bacterium]|nr:type II toxin-antitoxin system HicB family antitoxin [Planctomycetaceae bacterium]
MFSSGTYECKTLLIPEDDGGFSAFAIRLPGVISQGDTEEEALQNIAEAFRGAIQAYADLKQDIPWRDVEVVDRQKGSMERWIIVDV